jgi:hypothetical protein
MATYIVNVDALGYANGCARRGESVSDEQIGAENVRRLLQAGAIVAAQPPQEPAAEAPFETEVQTEDSTEIAAEPAAQPEAQPETQPETRPETQPSPRARRRR